MEKNSSELSPFGVESDFGIESEFDSKTNFLPQIGNSTKTEMPRYAQPSMSAMLPQYPHLTTQKIREAFSTSGYTTISKLPSNLNENSILKTVDESHGTDSEVKRPWIVAYKPLKGQGLFHEFEYIPSKYTLAEDLAREEHAKKEAQSHIDNKKAFLPTGSSVKLKHEGMFDDGSYPYMGDPFEECRDQESRLRWIDAAKELYGPFIPSGKQKSNAVKADLPDIIRYIHGNLVEDWPDQNFSVLTTENDMICVRFETENLDCAEALLGYMNVMAQSDRKITEFGLLRHLKDWNREPGDGHVYFLFRPPWVSNISPNTLGMSMDLLKMK